MTTRMMHPQHGWTHAYGDGEIKRLEGLGWSVEQPITVSVVNGDASRQPEELIELPVVDAPVKRQPGRPRKVA